MKKAIVVSFALLLASAASAQTWFKGSVDEAVAKAKRENKLVILDFYSSG
jgi:TRAP-type C4-dicarboxylate transport system substrate-binding protein